MTVHMDQDASMAGRKEAHHEDQQVPSDGIRVNGALHGYVVIYICQKVAHLQL